MDDFTIHHKHILGKGTFGTVYLAYSRINKKLVAVKIEAKTSKSLLKKEYGILKFLKEQDSTVPGHNNIMNPLLFLEDNKSYYMFTDLYGPNIDYMHRKCNRKFSVNTVLHLIRQMYDAVRYCHRYGIVHRDIKPSNFMVGFCDSKNVYLGDYGLSRKYMINGQHIAYQTDIQRVGSMRYMSKYTHRGIQSSCRDDLYSLAYSIIFIATGWLPWSDDLIEGKDKNVKHNILYSLKSKTSSTVITERITETKLQMAIKKYLDYVDKLEFGEPINYNYISDILTAIDVDSQLKFTKWDWEEI